MYSWSRKLGQAIAGGLVGWALGWIGYQSGGVEQNQSVLDGIYTLGTLVPALLLVSLLAPVFWYPVSYTHLTLPTIALLCRSRWSPYH